MLSITPNFTMQDLQDDLNAFQQGMKQDLVYALTATLHDLVDRAPVKTKAAGGFNNLTWNLRGSIGGCIMMDHEIVETYFPPLGLGEEGRQIGINYAADIAHLQDDGEIIMVFVAGMDYSYYVEAKDHDVISGTSKFIDKFFKAALSK